MQQMARGYFCDCLRLSEDDIVAIRGWNVEPKADIQSPSYACLCLFS